MRALISASAVTVAAAVLLLSAPAYATPGGDNGTVKVHDAATGKEYDRQNDPTVCSFYLEASFFDSRQQVTWQIVGMPPTGAEGTVAETDTLTLDARGHGRTDDLRLKDGHYELVWNFHGEHGRAESKVFQVDCDGVPGQDVAERTPQPSPSVSEESAPAPNDSTVPSPASTETGPGAGDEPSPQPSPSGGADLAKTGSSVPAGALAAAAASMLGAGTYLVLRRREYSRSRKD
jgi:LPXTG-motif cell wall-anchored protein